MGPWPGPWNYFITPENHPLSRSPADPKRPQWPLHKSLLALPVQYEEDSDASYLAHPYTPPAYLPMLEGVQPAGYDYHYLGLGWGPGQGDEGSQHEDPLAAPDSL